MTTPYRAWLRLLVRAALGLMPMILLLCMQGCRGGSSLTHWHTDALSEEFTAEMAEERIRTLGDYVALEERLFRQLDEQVVAKTPIGPEHVLVRYSRGSAADPSRWPRNWNRTFELKSDAPRAGVLLLHGMSDSPYSVRAIGQALNGAGHWVLGLRLPGHGTAPSGLTTATWQDMAAAARLAMRHLAGTLGEKPVHIIGYSNGGPLALDLALRALEQRGAPAPASLVLISPAIRVHPASALARFKDALSGLPGVAGLGYLSVMDEFDPFKYNSFATNAAAQVHAITRDVERRIRALADDDAARLPPILALKSAVDSTVTTEAVVDNLLMRLPAGRNALMLFDINRGAAIQSTLLVKDPAPLTTRLMADDQLPFALSVVTNASPQSADVVVHHKPSFSAESRDVEPLELSWPRGVVSLSHVALTFPPDDPLYGRHPPQGKGRIFLGDMALRGELGILRLPSEWLLRQRFNPFYAYLERRVLEWLADSIAE